MSQISIKQMNRYLLLFAISFTVLIVKGQQDPQFSHNMFSHIATNPGAAGSEDGICATAMHRLQWVGMEGAPTTSFFAVDAAISPFGINSGVGLIFSDDKLGFEDNFDLKLAYAYHTMIAGGNLGIGMNFGILNKSFKGDWRFPDPSKSEDMPKESNDTNFDMDFGVFYRNNRLFLGISAKHLLEPELTINAQRSTKTKRHYYLTGGYRLSTPIPSLEVEPSAFIKSDASGFQFSINTNVVYNKKFWGGVTYRADDSVIALLGLELLNGLKLGYAYDITTSDVRKHSDGTHEIFLRYCFEISVPQYTQKYKSARFL